MKGIKKVLSFNMDYSCTLEKLTKDQLIIHFSEIRNEIDYDNKFLEEWIHKMSMFASFEVARHANKLIGLIAFYANNQSAAFVTYVWVDKAYRGFGICGKMLSQVEDNVKHKSYHTIKLEVKKTNASAIKAYTKQGYTICSETDNSFYMSKTLS